MKRGFTLVEVMIAIVILTAGVLALAATSGGVTRLVSQGGRISGAAIAAEGRLEILRNTTPCTAIAGGTATDGSYALSWTVTTNALLRTVVIQVSYPTGRSTRTDTYTTAISCAT